ncbi:uncharacterized protein LOC118458300 [Anopheles albimanus]|uniref:uncharacterized protein LOC118458300 n=1 Tax=Anopheles albimanus TaxID=7167 RepID=UPI00163E001D|nr:uncharacterized protein LOC118458300 [Anopheles albimanus]
MSPKRDLLKTIHKKQICYINSLPEEVLRIIFDRLDLKSVKSAAETCQRWHSIIFLTGYINRFVFTVYLSSFHWANLLRISDVFSVIWPPGYPRNTTGGMQTKEFKAMLAKSQRCYRHLACSYEQDLEDHEIATVWETIHPKVTTHLHSFKLSFLKGSKLLPLISDALPLMSELRSFTLTGYGRDWSTQDVILTLRSDFLKHLTIESDVKYRLDMPHLQTFAGRQSAFYLPDDNRQSVALCSLKNLTVYCYDYNDTDEQRLLMLESMFRQTQLVTIQWYGLLLDEIFSLICETCTTLRELHLHLELEPSIVDDLNSLSKLSNLRILVIDFCSIGIDLSTLNQLEELQLSRVKNIVKLPTSIRKLRVHIWSDNELNMSHTILSSSNQLTELLVWIDEKDTMLKYSAPLHVLKALPHLKHLKVLKFYGGSFGESSFLCMDAPLDTLQQLHFEESHVSSKRFIGFQEKFPNLQKLRFSKCGFRKDFYDRFGINIFYSV